MKQSALGLVFGCSGLFSDYTEHPFFIYFFLCERTILSASSIVIEATQVARGRFDPESRWAFSSIARSASVCRIIIFSVRCFSGGLGGCPLLGVILDFSVESAEFS